MVALYLHRTTLYRAMERWRIEAVIHVAVSTPGMAAPPK